MNSAPARTRCFYDLEQHRRSPSRFSTRRRSAAPRKAEPERDQRIAAARRDQSKQAIILLFFSSYLRFNRLNVCVCVCYLVLPAGYPRAYPGQGPASTGPPPAADPLLACRPLSGALSCALPSGDPAPLLEFWTVPPPGACSRRWLLRSNPSTLPELPDLSGSPRHGRAVCNCPAVALRPLGFVAFARLIQRLEPARLACLVDSAVTKSHGI